MFNILDGIALSTTVIDDVSEVSSDPSDEEMMVTCVLDEVFDLDGALLALPALERKAFDIDANKTLPDPNTVAPPNRSHICSYLGRSVKFSGGVTSIWGCDTIHVWPCFVTINVNSLPFQGRQGQQSIIEVDHLIRHTSSHHFLTRGIK